MSGTLQPIPADSLAALYDTNAKSLILTAEGEAQPLTFDIKFLHKPFFGGLLFELVGRTLAVEGGKKKYPPVDNPFPMAAPIVPNVIIITANNPHGQVVPIHFTGLTPPSNDKDSAPSGDGVGPQLPIIKTLGDEVIHVINGKTFKIHFPSEVPTYGSINEDHDDHFLQLQTAGIQDKDISWTFKAIQFTKTPTQISLFISGGIAQFVYRKVYTVYVDLGAEVTIQSDHKGKEKGNEDFLEPFITFVYTGLRIVQEQYPSAQIYVVDAKSPLGFPVTSPVQLVDLKLECDIGNQKLAVLSSQTWGQWGPISIIRKGLGDKDDIPWKENMMDILDADKLMKAEGIKQGYYSAVLEKPVQPEFPVQPYYVFHMVQLPGGPSQVFVGLDDKKVYPYGQVLSPEEAKA
ncbi:hypothetical protein P7C71_g235, partial [Lecanoromycetidae sp. Uapishka_2]